MIKSKCTDGRRVSQETIDREYSKSLREKHAGKEYFTCEGCGMPAVHNDHTIARARCKQLHKTELIWDPNNYVSSCAKCHQEWEDWKSGKYLEHHNAAIRMLYLKRNYPERYTIRMGHAYP